MISLFFKLKKNIWIGLLLFLIVFIFLKNLKFNLLFFPLPKGITCLNSLKFSYQKKKIASSFESFSGTNLS